MNEEREGMVVEGQNGACGGCHITATWRIQSGRKKTSLKVPHCYCVVSIAFLISDPQSCLDPSCLRSRFLTGHRFRLSTPSSWIITPHGVCPVPFRVWERSRDDGKRPKEQGPSMESGYRSLERAQPCNGINSSGELVFGWWEEGQKFWGCSRSWCVLEQGQGGCSDCARSPVLVHESPRGSLSDCRSLLIGLCHSTLSLLIHHPCYWPTHLKTQLQFVSQPSSTHKSKFLKPSFRISGILPDSTYSSPTSWVPWPAPVRPATSLCTCCASFGSRICRLLILKTRIKSIGSFFYQQKTKQTNAFR